MNKNNHITEMLTEYLDGFLSLKETKMVEAHLTNCETCMQDMESLKVLLNAFESEEELIPSTMMETKFIRQLENEKKAQSKVVPLSTKAISPRNPWTNHLLKMAAGFALLVGSFLLGRQQSQVGATKEIAQLIEEKSEFKQTAMLSLMENKSASRRIQGVNFLNGHNQPDKAIIKALADRMLYDENVNVRAAAVEVLVNFTSSESVIRTFIEALKIENDPGIQIAIIQILGNIQEKKAVEPMRELMEKEGTLPFVKKQIESVLPNIT